MATKAKSLSSVLITLFVLLTFIYVYPRVLLSFFAKDNPWLNYLYMYGFGLVFFGFGIWLILKTKACQFGRGQDALWFKALLAGFVFFASVHGIWIYLALSVPFLGAE